MYIIEWILGQVCIETRESVLYKYKYKCQYDRFQNHAEIFQVFFHSFSLGEDDGIARVSIDIYVLERVIMSVDIGSGSWENKTK